MANSVEPDRSTLIWVYTVCKDLSVRKLRNITATLNFFGTSKNFPSIFRVFWMILVLFLYKMFFYLRTLKNIETFLETKHLFFWPKNDVGITVMFQSFQIESSEQTV